MSSGVRLSLVRVGVGGCLLGIAAVLSGCPQATFQCSEDSACVLEGIAGTCEPNGFCSFPDEECSSGRRFGQEAPAEFASICVSPEGSTGEDGLSSSTGTASTSLDTTLPELTTGTGSTESLSGADSGEEGGTSATGETMGPGPNVVFVSSIGMSPADVTPATADELCSQLATDAGLFGTYVAWISSDDEDAVERLGTARGWIRPDGQPFVDRQTDLIEGRVLYPPVLDENGNPKRGRVVLTATASDGTATDFNCENWTDFTDGYFSFGRPGGGAELWASGFLRSCSDVEPVHLYCFGVDLTSPVEYQPVEGRFAFVTQGEAMGSAGLDAFDALCNQEAEGGGLPGTYRALVATEDSSAFDRFDTTGPTWVNTLGVPLAESASVLPELAHLEVAPSFTAVGEPVGGEYWTGASSPSSVSGNTCSDWTAIDGLGDFYYAAATTDWFDAPAHNCDASDRLLCLQE